jgi:hypothetical protein
LAEFAGNGIAGANEQCMADIFIHGWAYMDASRFGK